MAGIERIKIGENWYKEYAAKIFANSIGTDFPKVLISDEKINEKFKQILPIDEFAKLHYKLVQQLSLNGSCVLGLISPDKKPMVILSDIATTKYDIHGALQSIDIFFKKSFVLQKKLDDKLLYGFAVYETNTKKIEFTQIFQNLPFVEILNNATNENDFATVPIQMLKDYVLHLDLLPADSLTSKAIIHINTPQMQSSLDNFNELIKTIYDPSKAVFENKNIWSLLGNGGLQIQQGISNYQSLIEKLKFYDNKMRDLAFIPRNTLDAGTKNIHNAEASQINSNADDYIEVKANLLEYGYIKFIKTVLFDYLKNNCSEYSNYEFENVKVEVEVVGSTNYLKNQANEYLQTQQGTIINPNRVNQTKNNKKEDKDDTAKQQQ